MRALTLLLAAILSYFAPQVFSFRKDVYGVGEGRGAHSQNWAVACAPDGTMYFGNGNGLLSCDGMTWRLDAVPGGCAVRSVYINEDGRIYVGSFKEFGYFLRTETGEMKYVSLSSELVGYQMQNDEIWRIFPFGGKVVFQSFSSYFVFGDGEVSAVRTPGMFLFFCNVGSEIFASYSDFGLCRVNLLNGLPSPVKCPFTSRLVETLQLREGKYVFVTESDGLFLYEGGRFSSFMTDVDRELMSLQVNRAAISGDGGIVVGTKLGGVFKVDVSGRRKWSMDASEGLPGNTVLGIGSDREGNVWLAVDGGIVMVCGDGRLSVSGPLSPPAGSVYSTMYEPPYLYIGTNQGLYRAFFSPADRSYGEFVQVSEVNGNVWNLSRVDGQIFCGTNGDTFEISGARVSPISPISGGMCLDRGTIAGKDVIVQGTYSNICLYSKDGGEWHFLHLLDGFMEPLSSIAIASDGTIWAGHLHGGLYRIKLSDDLESVEDVYVDETVLGKVSVFRFGSRVVISDGESWFSPEGDIPIRLDSYNSSLARFVGAHRAFPAGDDGKYWLITPEMAALVALFPDDGASVLDEVAYGGFGEMTVDNNQSVVAVSPELSIIALDNALAIHDNRLSGVEADLPPPSFAAVTASDAASEQQLRLPLAGGPSERIPYHLRNLNFSLSYPLWSHRSSLEFLYRLDGLDAVWHRAQGPAISYDYLHERSRYKLRVKAVSGSAESRELVYDFSIAPPFYRSIPANVFYAALFAAVCLFIVQLAKRRLRARSLAVEKAHREEVERLEKERLESEVKLKSRDLASVTMNLIRKNEILIKLKDDIQDGKSTNRLVKTIESELDSGDDWNLFQKNFDLIHENFFRNLQSRYPELTANDLRFCAFLRLNLSSKDIASLMNISLKGVEAARARLRKKFYLDSKVNLSVFLIDLK